MLAGIQHLELKPWGIYPVLKNQHSFGGEDLFNTTAGRAAYVNHAWGLDSRLHLSLSMHPPTDALSSIASTVVSTFLSERLHLNRIRGGIHATYCHFNLRPSGVRGMEYSDTVYLKAARKRERDKGR